MNEREIKKFLDKVNKLANDEKQEAKTKSILCSVDLGVVVLQVALSLN